MASEGLYTAILFVNFAGLFLFGLFWFHIFGKRFL